MTTAHNPIGCRVNFILCTLALALAVSLQAQNTVRYEARPGSTVKIDGTSSIHDWWAESKIISGFMEFDAAADADLAKLPQSKPKVEISIPVRSLKSSSGRLMDNVMYDAMDQEKHPKIEYRLLELTPKAGARGSATKAEFDARGALTVHGVTRTNTMPVTIEHTDKSNIKVTGATDLKMTDFNIQPPAPKLLLGAIKTGDEVKLTFEWPVAHKEASK